VQKKYVRQPLSHPYSGHMITRLIKMTYITCKL
jgi:hypothetical protein